MKAGIPNCELRFYGSGELVPWLRELGRILKEYQQSAQAIDRALE